MEFHEKLQYLRKQKGLTQEELAQSLYVSRTAISKWESGRGYPSIDSLKAISRFFSITMDELLCSEEILAIAEEDGREKQTRFMELMFGLLDCSMVLFLFLPLFRQFAHGATQAVSLAALSETPPYIKTAYWAVIIAAVLLGAAELALQNMQNPFWAKGKRCASLACSAVCILLWIISRQPYAAALAFVFGLIKVWLLLKQR